MMGVITDVIVRDRENPLQTALNEYEDVELEIQSSAADEGAVAPFVWIRGPTASIDAVESACDVDPVIRSYECLNDDGDNANETRDRDDNEQRLYRIEWDDDRSVLGQLVEQEGTVVSATLDAEGWHAQLLFPARDALSTAYDAWDTSQWDVYIERIVSCDDEPLETHGLTDEQHRAMKRAVEMGYYDIPRQTTLQDLAADLDISHQALSERLRRANRTLVTNTVCDPDESEERSPETADPVRILE